MNMEATLNASLSVSRSTRWLVIVTAGFGFAFDLYEMVVQAIVLRPMLTELGPFQPGTRLRLITIWNVVGLVDILMVVVTAARLGLSEPASMRALTVLPLSLLPTFLVPLIIATHILIFARIRRENAMSRN